MKDWGYWGGEGHQYANVFWDANGMTANNKSNDMKKSMHEWMNQWTDKTKWNEITWNTFTATKWDKMKWNEMKQTGVK